MRYPWLPRSLKRSFLTNIGIIAILGMILTACGGGSSSSGSTASTSSSCVPGSNTKFVKITHPIKKVGWSQNALDGAWRFAEEQSITDAAKAHHYDLVKTNANNSDVQQVQDIETLISDRPDV